MSTSRSGIGVVTSVPLINMEVTRNKVGRAIQRVDGELNLNTEDKDYHDGYREALLDVYNLLNYGIRPVNNSRYGPFCNKGDWWR